MIGRLFYSLEKSNDKTFTEIWKVHWVIVPSVQENQNAVTFTPETTTYLMENYQKNINN